MDKEECEEVLETFKNFACIITTCCKQTREEIEADKKLFNECVKNFEQLINEHFDNPPLKFEELREGMWVWDNKCKSYGYIHRLCRSDGTYLKKGNYVNFSELNSLGENYSLFEEGRFYAREVKG